MIPNRGVLGALSAVGVIVLVAGLALGADGAVRQGVVHMRAGAVRTADRPNALDGAAFAQKWNLIVIDGSMDPARRALLAGAGVTLAGYLPENAFIADLSATTPARVKALPFVIWAGPYQKEWKVDADLLAGANGRPFVTQPRQAMAAQGLVATDVWLFRGEPQAPVDAAVVKLANARVTVSETIEGSVHLHIIMQAKDAAQLAEIPGLMFAEHAAEYTPRSNATTRWVIQTDQLNMTPFYDNGITGVGQVVGMIDGGLVATHCSFFDPAHPIGPLHRKIIAADPNPPGFDPHGTHTSCTAVGDAGDNSDTRGIAYGARMTFQYYPDPNATSVTGRFQFAHDHGARIHSNSWGDDSIWRYDGPCSAIDAFMHTNEDDLILFAVTDLNSFVRNPENAKNALAVSLSGQYPDEMNTCNNYGGHGPTADGRRKPEVMAPGCSINSAAPGGCATQALTGTSMACPAVAGAAALVREYFMDGFYPSGHARTVDALMPTGSLIKAVLASSSVDMTGIADYPSDKEGWGRVLLSGAVPFGSDPRHKLLVRDVRHATGLESGQEQQLAFYMENCAGAQLHVTLAYADFPGVPQSPTDDPTVSVRVNNLDLVVTAPTGDVYYGNYFIGGVSAPGGAPDERNNLEQVLVASPQPGRWVVRVLGTDVPQGPQGYALIVTGAIDQNACGSADFDCDGDTGTDADIEAFFAALAGGFGDADFNRDGDVGTDADIEAFFRVLAGNPC